MRGRLLGGRAGVLVLVWFGWMSLAAYAGEQLRVKPGFNLFSPQQDIQVGRENAADIDKKLPLVNDPAVLQYVNNLGRRLASFAPYNNDYPWSFKVVNSQDINAFALPGGYIYVNRGAIEAAEDEAQLAGVMAHEISHVALRHGTNQATKRVGLSVLTGMLGQGSSLTAQLAEAGLGFGVNSLLLRNSRTDESQADEVGTYIMHQAGYDPHAMAQFFQIIEKKYPQRTLQFFSDHPNPDNRVKAVDAFIATLGPSPGGTTNSGDFEAAKKRLLGMPPPPKASAAAEPASSGTEPPVAPSAHLVRYQGAGFSIDYPDNWQVYGSDNDVKLAPAGGLLDTPEGGAAQAYGASITLYRPPNETGKRWELVDATQHLVEFMRQANPNLSVAKQSGMKLRGRPARSTAFVNDSPIAGQKEQGELVTVRSQDQLLALVFVSPEPAYDSYRPTFEAMLRSLVMQ
jgi:beta-barrel assembly-enhancing protease